MARPSRSNPLALAVLTCLYEKPMHPYEISQTLRERGVDRSVRLNFGSLYSVVASLEKVGHVRAGEKVREGKRPERTTYEITDAGTEAMTEWLSELVASPVKEYLQFEAGLALLGGLHPDRALELLRQRVETLDEQIERDHAEATGAMRDMGLPRLFLLEWEYQDALQRAELEWLRQLVADFESGELGGLAEWRVFQETGRREWKFEPMTNTEGQEDK